MTRLTSFPALAVVLFTGFSAGSFAAEPAEMVSEQCSGCHQIEGPANTDLQARRERAAPPLFFAGNKFREDWLVTWLQSPTRIRPAGDFSPAHTKTTADGDVVDESTLAEHPAVDAETATAMAAYLMTLRPKDDLIAAEASYAPAPVPERLGAMDFVKFKGCGACHKDTPKYGGVSGPELYTAWHRLQPEFAVSYIRNPTAWEPNTLMPVKHLQDAPIHKLVNYLKTIGQTGEAK